MSCGRGHRCGSDLAWLWHRLVATAPIGPLAWDPPHAAGVALKRQKKKKKKKDRNEHLPNKNRLMDIENRLAVAKGEERIEGWD